MSSGKEVIYVLDSDFVKIYFSSGDGTDYWDVTGNEEQTKDC
ncbi:6517_t:CDS:2 [Acaulospora morrowiae]|uniref:6517_t:CDS:1 n=1 Tax=Acaulospora morrowiae TaxID=94023 RepID=A0A9N9DHU1_9GLOM|nr:6517_t:CDS:2 [Acaulospora morrowiae]